MLWFVKFGKLAFTDQSGCRLIGPGDFALTPSKGAFRVECRVDIESLCEILHVTLPTQSLSEYIAGDIAAPVFMPKRRRELLIAENLLTDVLEDDNLLTEGSTEAIIHAALSLVGTAVNRQDRDHSQQRSIRERRVEDIMRYIEVNLSNPGLTHAGVAKACGVSPRYLTDLIDQTGTNFTSLLWRRRLENARAWLETTRPQDISIAEIAYGMGFKSPCHFSRMFKKAFNTSPRYCHGTRATSLLALAASGPQERTHSTSRSYRGSMRNPTI